MFNCRRITSSLFVFFALPCIAVEVGGCGDFSSFHASMQIVLEPGVTEQDVANDSHTPTSSLPATAPRESPPAAHNSGSSGSGGQPAQPGSSLVVATNMLFDIRRVAGDAIGGSEAGTAPLAVRFRRTSGLVTTPNGTIYVCDSLGHQIRCIPPSGNSFVVAGSDGENAGYFGDNIPAVADRLDTPVGLAREGRSGALFVCDSKNQRIRYFVPGGRIYTYAGGGSDRSDNVERATDAALLEPFGLALDGQGNVYFTERGSGRVRVIEQSGRLVTLATLTPNQVGPIAVDNEGNRVWVGDGDTLRLILPQQDPPLQDAPLWNAPGTIFTGLAFDQGERLYVSRTAQVPFGLKGTCIFCLRVDPLGLVSKPRQLVAGTGDKSDNSLDYSIPTAKVPDARTQLLAGAGFCSLYIDLHHANDPDVLSGILFAGNAVPSDGIGINWSQIARLAPH